jgi:phosphoenolpyruvate---glycerone phosphotransferase subunit DhaK
MKMKKIIGNPNRIVEDTLEGFAHIYSDRIEVVPGTHIVERRVSKAPGKVRFMIGNGAGHEPAVIGWVGEGLFDMNVVGEIFSAPAAEEILRGIERLAPGGPVLIAVQNHAGDVLNANLAVEMALAKGIQVEPVLFYDDIASAPKGFEEERRGMVGMMFYAKIVGAKAERGAGIAELKALFEKCRDQTRTYSVAITNCTNPITGISMFDHLAEDEIELGMGVHGEGSGNALKIPTSSELVKFMVDKLVEDYPYSAGDDVLVVVNGAGSTTLMELFIYYNELKAYLESKGMRIRGVKVGNFLTTQELSGISLSLCKADDEMIELWNDPCGASYF